VEVERRRGSDAVLLRAHELLRRAELASLGQSNASKHAPSETAAPKAARMARALEGSGFVLVPASRTGQPVQLSVDVDVDARLCETPPCGSLHLVASMEVAASDLALSAGAERVFRRERVVVQP
jgi:hypothetical protein